MKEILTTLKVKEKIADCLLFLFRPVQLTVGNVQLQNPQPSYLHASRDTAYWERWNARINDNVSGWCVGYSTDREWYQITLDAEHYITTVANQGTHRGFVCEFSLAFSRGLGWFDYKENGTIKV